MQSATAAVPLPSLDHTQAWGQRLAADSRPGQVIALCGQLGAGKTHVVKAIVQALGSDEVVTSPTFGLVHEYRRARLPVFHFDFYRLRQAAELLSLGWDEILDEPGLVVVEWADLFPELLPAHTQWWQLSIDADDQRWARPGQPQAE